MSELSEQAIENGVAGGVEERQALTETLAQLAGIGKYNRWMYEQFSSHLGKRVLEVGSGIGNITAFLAEAGRTVVATDVIPSYRDELEIRFKGNSQVTVDVFDLDREAPGDFTRSPFDNVVCLNVLEHIEDDLGALRAMGSALKDDGKLILLVPAHQFLFGAFDVAVGHFRRYSKKLLSSRLQEAGFEINELKFFNIAATLPWLLNGPLSLERRKVPARPLITLDPSNLVVQP